MSLGRGAYRNIHDVYTGEIQNILQLIPFKQFSKRNLIMTVCSRRERVRNTLKIISLSLRTVLF